MRTPWIMGKRADGTTVAAIGLVLLSGLLYVLGYSLSKRLVGTYGLSALQVTFLRCVLVLVACFAALPWPGSRVTFTRIWRPVRVWEQRTAAAALVASNVLAVLAYSLMPVTAASALGFTAPLLLTALGGLMLRERVSAARWIGTAVGFGGMLLIVKPGRGLAPLGMAAAVGSAVTYAIYQVLVRRLREVASSLDTTIQVGLMGVLLLAGTMFAFWHEISPEAFEIVLICTGVQTAALASIAAALRRGEASRLAPWQFSGLLWAMLLDTVMFGVQPSGGSLFGGALIIAGGLLAQGASRTDRVQTRSHFSAGEVDRRKRPAERWWTAEAVGRKTPVRRRDFKQLCRSAPAKPARMALQATTAAISSVNPIKLRIRRRL